MIARSAPQPWGTPTVLVGAGWLLAYTLIVLAPATLATILTPAAYYGWVYDAGRFSTLTAFAIITLQPVLSARIKPIERPFGHDLLMRFHRFMGIFAGLLVLAHPALLWLSQVPLPENWWVVLGQLALLALAVHVLISVFRRKIRLGFEWWRFLHDLLAPAVIVLAAIHSWNVGSDLAGSLVMKTLWATLTGLAVVTFSVHRIFYPLWLRRRPWTVSDVHQESPDVWTLEFSPPGGEAADRYLPGQYHFITLMRGRDLPEEEHHFTISSTPTRPGRVTSTIKESGDYTSTIGQTRPGDRAKLQGGYGRFSYVLHPGEREIVFCAGGIGITPVMSMIRHMHDTRSERRVLLLYGAKTAADLVFRQELEEIVQSEHPRLTLVPVLSHPGDNWQGETGYLDEEKLTRFVQGDLTEQDYYVVGPTPMSSTVIKALRKKKVPLKQIHYEEYAFAENRGPKSWRTYATLAAGWAVAILATAAIVGFALFRNWGTGV